MDKVLVRLWSLCFLFQVLIEDIENIKESVDDFIITLFAPTTVATRGRVRRGVPQNGPVDGVAPQATESGGSLIPSG